MDTPETQETETLETQTTGTETTPVEVKQDAPKFSWKSNLPADFANSPTMQKYPDSKDGLVDAVKSHLELQKMLGHDKVPIPKDANDTAAMAIFKKAFRIPEKPEGYGLPDVEVPKDMPGLSFDKGRFSAAVHKHNLTPEQAKGLWGEFAESMKTDYASSVKKYQDDLALTVNALRGEWGDAYASKVELGQMVINKFSSDQEMNDFVTATLAKDPRGVKFLAKIGDQFAENKIGDFKYQRHSLTPEEAEREIAAIRNDPNHPYNNEKIPQRDRDKAIDYVNSLYIALNRARTPIRP